MGLLEVSAFGSGRRPDSWRFLGFEAETLQGSSNKPGGCTPERKQRREFSFPGGRGRKPEQGDDSDGAGGERERETEGKQRRRKRSVRELELAKVLRS